MLDFFRPHESLLSWLIFGLVLIGLTISVANAFLDTTVWQLETQRYLAEPIDRRTGFAGSTLDTSTWKTYRNEQYGFEVRYPRNWSFDVMPRYNNDGQIAVPQSEFWFTDPILYRLIVEPFGTEVAFNALDLITEKETNLNGTVARRREFGDTDGVYEVVIDQFSNTKYPAFAVSFIPINAREYIDPGKVSELDQILSTFKFIEPVDTSTWKTYRSEKFGLAFRYPSYLGVVENGPDIYYPESGQLPSGTQAPSRGSISVSSREEEILNLDILDQKNYPEVSSLDGYDWSRRTCGQEGFLRIVSEERTKLGGYVTLHVVSESGQTQVPSQSSAHFYCVNAPNPVVAYFWEQYRSEVESVLETLEFFSPMFAGRQDIIYADNPTYESWDPDPQIREGLFRAHCHNLDGAFNPCGSACPDPSQPCVAVCAPRCEFESGR
ncbi:hypothetical protein HYW67_02165 [Candidatus Parcubacteria bacterium]|nr:hypothetical protein [Candidatus Parcubacteria bacterium]